MLLSFNFLRNSAAGNSAIVLFNLKAYEMPVRAYGRHGGRARSHAVVEYDIPLVGVCPYQVFYQRDGLLRRVVERTGSVFFRNVYYRSRVLVVRHPHGCHLNLPVAAVREYPGSPPPVVAPLRRTGFHLRVIDGLMSVKHDDILVLAQRHPVRVEMSRHAVFQSHEVVPPQPGLRKNQPCGEQPLSEQDNRTVGLGYPAVLFPQRFKRDGSVPTCRDVPAVQHAVRQIGYDGINAGIRHFAHAVQTIHVIYAVFLYHRVHRFLVSCPLTI